MDDELNDSSTDSRIPYLRLLNTVANELDCMLNNLYPSPPSRFHMSGDAFLEPYMEGLSNEDLFDDNCNGLKKDYPVHEDCTSSFSSPVNSTDTVLDEKVDSHFRLIEVRAGSQGSLNQLISGDECSESTSESSSLIGDEETPCDITLVERLIRSHPIWFLPGIQRAGAFHLLQGKEDGNFVVRQSSQNLTMAISVRLPSGKGPYIEHYLIQVSQDDQIGLESSDNKFSSIPLLIAHYCQCCDELPVQLTLPRAIREAKNRQQLTSLALLGQEFWRYPMANSRPSKVENDSPNSLPSVSARENNAAISNMLLLNSSGSNSPASSLSSFESSNNNNNSSSSALEQGNSMFDTDSSIPLEESSTHNNSGLMSTFKTTPVFSSIPYNQIGIPVTTESPLSLPVETSQSQKINIRRPRPTPPNTLNLISTTSSTIAKNSDNRSEVSSGNLNLLTTPTNKIPPPPPPRWTKPFTSNINNTQDFTVTTTLTFTVNKETSPPSGIKVSSFQVSSSTEKNFANSKITQSTLLTASLPTIVPTPLPRSHIPQITSPISPIPTSQILSPVSEGNTRPFTRRTRRHKESHHYQESDIIDSYHRSAVADKASDYEDIWGPDSLNTFKPQPPPRSMLFSSLDDFSTKKKTCPSPLSPDVSEKSLIPSPISSETSNNVNKNKCGLVFGTSEEEPCSGAALSSLLIPDLSEIKASIQNVSTPVELKVNNSSFYAEPADAINQAALKRRVKSSAVAPQLSAHNRHSDPPSLHQWPVAISDGGVLERIDSKEELMGNGGFSSSVDNLTALRNSKRISSITSVVKSAKPIEAPKLNQPRSKNNGETWTVDPNWEFISKESSEENEIKFNGKKDIEDRTLLNKELCKADVEASDDRNLTVQEMIFQRLPESRLSPVFNVTKNWMKSENQVSDQLVPVDYISANTYDTNDANDSNNNSNNSEKIYHKGMSMLSQISDTSDDTQTEFSDPWDSSQWEHLFNKSDSETISNDNNVQVNRCKSFKERLDPFLSPPRLKALAQTRVTNSAPGATVRAYAYKLAAEKQTVFAKAIDNFIACTMESRETRPQIVMRNMRQFMSGMKNYLVTHGEGEFIKEVECERSKLKSTEFLNLDAILEGVMHKLVISPLKKHLCQLFVKEYEENGAIQILVENIRYARKKSPSDLGIKERLVLPSIEDLKKISDLFRQLQKADSPLEKLEFLLSAIATIFHSIKEKNNGTEAIFLGADDFLPMFVWVLVQTGMVAAEVEAEYMWGLLHPSLLSGEGGYYLTTLSSAVNVLKNFRQCSRNENVATTIPWNFDPLAEFKCVFKVVVPNELNGSLLTKTLPVRPNMTTKDICKIIALKLRITNPQDFSLYKLVDGEETLLNDNDYPQDIKSELGRAGKHCLFAYKRIDAKIAWPRSSTPGK